MLTCFDCLQIPARKILTLLAAFGLRRINLPLTSSMLLSNKSREIKGGEAGQANLKCFSLLHVWHLEKARIQDANEPESTFPNWVFPPQQILLRHLLKLHTSSPELFFLSAGLLR